MAEQPIMVTGAAGFIGSHVAEALLSRGRRVLGVDSFDPFYPRAIKERNLAGVRAHPGGAGFEFVELDLTDEASLGVLAQRTKPEGIIHLAGQAGVRPSIQNPGGTMRANVLGTQSVLSAATACGAQRVVAASSSSVYGNSAKAPFREDEPALTPISPYAASKRAGELLSNTHHHLHKLPIACLRFFTVYGPRQRPDLAISLFLGKVSRGETISMFGDGSMARDYTYVDDIVAGVLGAYDAIDRHGFRVWNLGNSQPVRLDALIAAIGATTGREAKVERKPVQAGDVELTFADLTRSRAELGYEPRTTLAEGLARQWAWMQKV